MASAAATASPPSVEDREPIWGRVAVDLLNKVDVLADQQTPELRLTNVIEKLIARTEIWGALLNYPRTLLIQTSYKLPGKGVFSFSGQRNPFPLKAPDNRVHRDDFDQIIYVNAALGEKTRLVEINVVRMGHEEFRPPDTELMLRTVSIAGGDLPDIKAASRATDATNLLKDVFTESPNVGAEEPMIHVDNVGYTYIYRAAAILEALMRDRVMPVSELVGNAVDDGGGPTSAHRATDEQMKRAVAVGVVPYAAKDIVDETSQPPVMPGHLDMKTVAKLFNKLTVKEPASTPAGKEIAAGDDVSPGVEIERTDSTGTPAAETSSSGIAGMFAGARMNPYANINADVVRTQAAYGRADGDLVWASADGGLSPFDSSEDEFGHDDYA